MYNMALPYVQILAAAIISMVIGFIWYARPVFGDAWIKWSGIDKKKMDAGKKKMPILMIVQLISAIILAAVMSVILTATAAASVKEGLVMASWIWLGFITTTLIGSVLWEGKPVRLFVLNAAFHLVNLLVVAVILVSWT